MKTKLCFWRVLLISLTAMVCVGVVSCGSEDPEIPTPPPTPVDNGEVEFVIDLPTGSGSGSSSSPATVNPGETLNVEINQKSSYTDPDGTVFSCEPKATIVLSAQVDTVYAKDLTSLINVKESSDIKTNKTGTSPVINQTLQTFEIGGQHVVFDLSHEVYTYINSVRESIEMPYVKLNPANVGNSATAEEKPQGRSSIAMTKVTVRPLAKTRSTTIVDSTMYEVNVRFNLEVESVNTKSTEKQTLEFSVNYVGVVENVTELKDPVSEISYVWEVKSGTTNMAPPFKTQDKMMEVWMVQKSSYTDTYGNVATGEPIAKIKLTAAQDTIWVNSLDELKNFADLTGELPQEQSAIQKFGSEAQEVTIDWSYESGEALIAGQTVSMPYYALQPAKLKDVSVKDLGERMLSGKECAVYEVTATFSQKAVPQNVSKDTSEVEIEYVVSYIGATEIKLVKVEYFPMGYWEDPHDNMPLSYYASVERYRTYSNGKRVGPDRFEDYGHWPDFSHGGYTLQGYADLYEGWANGTPVKYTIIGDSIGILHNSIEVDQIRSYTYNLWKSEYTEGGFCDWEQYYPSHELNDERFDVAKDVEAPEYEADSRPNGWYYRRFRYRCAYDVDVLNGQEKPWGFLTLAVGFYFYDQFLVIDGRRIDFSKLHNLKMDFNTAEEDFSEPDKEGKIAKLEMRISYLGKNFYGAQVDSLFVRK